jgi:Tfp pilus assembly protein PilN
MINLLPPERKEMYLYAHRNTKLMRWVVSFAVAIVGLGVISTFGILYMYHSSSSYDKQVASLEQSLKDNKLTETEQQTKEVSNNLKLVVKVLSKEVLFSKLLKQLAAITPNNANLTDLNINQAQSGIDITAQAADYNAATQLLVNLKDPNNKIFSKADIVNISCANATSDVDPRYPCSVVIRALFAKDNPYLFINGKVKS